jgi:hypothetical protein
LRGEDIGLHDSIQQVLIDILIWQLGLIKNSKQLFWRISYRYTILPHAFSQSRADFHSATWFNYNSAQGETVADGEDIGLHDSIQQVLIDILIRQLGLIKNAKQLLFWRISYQYTLLRHAFSQSRADFHSATCFNYNSA